MSTTVLMFVPKSCLLLSTSALMPARATLCSLCPCRAHLSSTSKGLSHFAVPPSIAGSDEVSYATALQEGGRGYRALAEELGKGNHLHEPQPNHCCLGVVSKAQPITEASSNSHYILWGVEGMDEEGPLPMAPPGALSTCLMLPTLAITHPPSK